MTTTWVNDKSYYSTLAYITSQVSNIKSIMWRKNGLSSSSWSTNQFQTGAASNIGEIIVPANTVLSEDSKNLISVFAITKVKNYSPNEFVRLEMLLSYQGYYKYGSAAYTGLAFEIKTVEAVGEISGLLATNFVNKEISTWSGSQVMLTTQENAITLSGSGLIEGVPDLTIIE